MYIFFIKSHWILLRMRNVTDKTWRENQNTHFMFNNPPPPENPAVYELMWNKTSRWTGYRWQYNVANALWMLNNDACRPTLRICDTYFPQKQYVCESVCILRSNILPVLSLYFFWRFNPLKPELNPMCYLLALLGAHHFLHVSRIRVKSLTFRRLMSYIYGAPILDVSRSHTTTQHSR